MIATIKTTGRTFENVSPATVEVMRRVYGASNIVAVDVRHTHGARYPFKPECVCGAEFRGYLTRTAALLAAEDHTCA